MIIEGPEISPRPCIRPVPVRESHPFLSDRDDSRPSTARKSLAPSSSNIITGEIPEPYRPTRKLVKSRSTNSSNVLVNETSPSSYRPIRRPISNPADPSAAGVSTKQEVEKKQRFLRRQCAPPETKEEEYKPSRRMISSEIYSHTDPVGTYQEPSVTPRRVVSADYLKHTSKSSDEIKPYSKKLLAPKVGITECFHSGSPESSSSRRSLRVFPDKSRGVGEDVIKYQYHQGTMRTERPQTAEEKRRVIMDHTPRITQESRQMSSLFKAKCSQSNIIIG
ncbi:hypothetical protein P9112_004657 [Eukaryota sp. TZLM1-RC]